MPSVTATAFWTPHVSSGLVAEKALNVGFLSPSDVRIHPILTGVLTGLDSAFGTRWVSGWLYELWKTKAAERKSAHARLTD